MIKYGIGYYVMMGGIILSFLLGLLDLFTKNKDASYSSSNNYASFSNTINMRQGQPMQNMNNNQNINQEIKPIINQTPNNIDNAMPSDNSMGSTNSIRLSDIVNNNRDLNQTTNDQTNSEQATKDNNIDK
jgi:hypothetical protein